MSAKRATRYKVEIVDAFDRVVWEILVHDDPAPALDGTLRRAGYTIRRASEPKNYEPTLPFSMRDPETSIRAAYEHDARRQTQQTRLLLYLVAHEGRWIDRETIRRIGGDSGDKRVRELRAMNWPIEITQLSDGEAWHVRLVLPEPVAIDN